MKGGRPYGWRFIDLAQLGRNTAGSYLLTSLRVIVLMALFLVIVVAAVYAAVAGRLLAYASVPATFFVAGFAIVIVGGAALVWGVVRSHRRPWRSLVSPDPALDFRRMAIGAGVEGALMAIFAAVGYGLFGDRPPTTEGEALALPAAAVAIVLTPFQAASEEVLFRGYLTQGLGRKLRSRLAIAAIVGLLFAAAHFNAYGPLTLPYLLVLSLTYSLVSLRDERLELAIGAHTANNWLAIFAFTAGYSPFAVKVQWPMIALLLVNGALFYGITRLFVRLCCERRLTAGAASG